MSARMRLADTAWLGLDRPEHLMVVTVVLELGGRVELTDLQQLVADRLVGSYPRFRQEPVPSRWPLVPPTWQDDPDFTVAAHVRQVDLPDSAAALRQFVANLMGTPLDLHQALWSLTLVQQAGRSTLVARLHHCLADGIALAGVLLTLVDGHEPAESAQPTRPGGSVGSKGSLVGGVAGLVTSAARLVAQVLVGRSDSASPLRARASVGRRAAWTTPLDLAVVKTAAHRLEVSVNDVLLAATAGGLRQWLLDHSAATDDCRVLVPVDLRRGEPAGPELGNRFGVVFVELPVSLGSAAGRVAAVHAATSAARSSAMAPASYALLSFVGLLPHWGQGLAAELLGRVATAIVTNVPGPRTELTLLDVPLTGIVFWVPHIGPVGIGFSIFSYNGAVTVGVATNESLDIDPGELVRAVEAELAELTRLS